jgi:hypothetical protein
VAAAAAARSLPHALALGLPGPDAIEHLAIANAWVHGAGFVDPVKWHHYLTGPPPLPATAVRPPAVPMLAALAFSLGASLRGVFVLHALWAAGIGVAFFACAGRLMRWPAAAAAALLLVQSDAWVLLSSTPATEVTAVGALILVLFTARGVTRSSPRALACAAATVAAWLVRPNLAGLVLAVAVAAGWRGGPGRSGAWLYLLAALGLGGLVHLGVASATGLAPYAGYGVVAESLGEADRLLYQREWVGARAFVEAHWREILPILALRAQQLLRALCLAPDFLYVGWLAPTGLWFALRARRASEEVELRAAALALLGFALVVIGNYAAFEGLRYPLLVAVPAWLCGLAWIDALAARLEQRLRARRPGRPAAWVGALPLALALAIFAVGLASGPPRHLAEFGWDRYRELYGEDWRRLCPHLDADAVVATPDPWPATTWCGNAAVRLPLDLAEPEARDRFLGENRVRYLVVGESPPLPWLPDRARFRRLGTSGSLVLHELREPGPAVWRAPPPLVCAGLDPDCAGR